MLAKPIKKDYISLCIMSRRDRYTSVGNRQRFSSPGYTTTGIPVGGLSVPIGCLTPYGGMPFTLDGGHTWFDPYTGSQVVQTLPPQIHIDPYGRVVGVTQHVSKPVQLPQLVQPQTDVFVNQRTGERVVVPRQTQSTPHASVFGSQPSPQVQAPVQHQPMHQPVQHQSAQVQSSSQLHPSIIETGTRDQFSGKELIMFKGVQCYPPNGVRNYIYNCNRTSVTLVVTEPNGAQWSRTLDI